MSDLLERLLDPERGGGSDAFEAAAEIKRLLEQVTQWQDLAADMENRLEATLQENERLTAEVKDWRLAAKVEANERRRAHAENDQLRAAGAQSVIPGTNIPDAGTPSY